MHIGNLIIDEFIHKLMKEVPRIMGIFMGKEALWDIKKERLGKGLIKVIAKMIQHQNKLSLRTLNLHLLILECQLNQILLVNSKCLQRLTNF